MRYREDNLEQPKAWVKNANKRRYANDVDFRADAVRRTREWRQRTQPYAVAVYGEPVAIEDMTRDRFRAARALGYRSGLEVAIARDLEARGVAFQYEPFRIHYVRPQQTAQYTPDVVLPNGIIIELKGLFQTADRKKHKIIKEQAPDLDVRFVFSNANSRIGKLSKTTYAKWCDQFGFKWAHKSVPAEWLTEPPNKASLAAIQRMRKK